LVKIPATLLLLGGLFYGTYWYLAIHLPDERREREDPIYAARVFTDYVQFHEVLATRAWHRRGAEPWDCTYAIVSLSENAPEVPPDLPTDRQDQLWYLAFGDTWVPTPAPQLDERTRDALGACAQYFTEDVNRRLAAAMAEPGSWHVIGSIGETVHIYSVPQRIAARVRYGD